MDDQGLELTEIRLLNGPLPEANRMRCYGLEIVSSGDPLNDHRSPALVVSLDARRDRSI